MPEKYIKEVNDIIFKFIWKRGRDKLKRAVMVKNKENGGLRAPDLSLMIEVSRIKWVKRYLDTKTRMCPNMETYGKNYFSKG